MSEKTNLGFSGSLARKFQDSKITPLLALTGLLMGAFAIAVTPREEEPQINVTFANLFVPRSGRNVLPQSCDCTTRCTRTRTGSRPEAASCSR